MKNLDEVLLQEYMANFYGYGNLKSDYWFIGMEEGGGNSKKEIISRLDKWESDGKPTLLDVFEFCNEVMDDKGKNLDSFFRGTKSKYQPTWGGLIKILLNFINEKVPTLEEVKFYQSESLGRSDSNNCLVEVFPLPSPSSGVFHYSEWTSLEFLRTRAEYKRHLQEKRITKLKNLISENKPKFVVFYSSNPEYIDYWSKISGVDFHDIEKEEIQRKNERSFTAKFKRLGETCFAVVHHPTYTGVTNEYLREVGKRMRSHHDQL